MNKPDTKQHQANQTIYLVEPDKLMRERIASLYTSSSSCSVMMYTCAEDFLKQSGIVAGCLVLGKVIDISVLVISKRSIIFIN
jgi:FixJ family two-component response regulator